jgi:hypothetical protein
MRLNRAHNDHAPRYFCPANRLPESEIFGVSVKWQRLVVRNRIRTYRLEWGDVTGFADGEVLLNAGQNNAPGQEWALLINTSGTGPSRGVGYRTRPGNPGPARPPLRRSLRHPIASPAGLPSEAMVTLNYAIPDDLHHKLKVLAAQQGVTLKALVIEALQQYADSAEDDK